MNFSLLSSLNVLQSVLKAIHSVLVGLLQDSYIVTERTGMSTSMHIPVVDRHTSVDYVGCVRHVIYCSLETRSISSVILSMITCHYK